MTSLSEVRDDLPTLDDGINDMLSGMYRMTNENNELAMCINRLGSPFALIYRMKGQEYDLKAALFCYAFVLSSTTAAPSNTQRPFHTQVQRLGRRLPSLLCRAIPHPAHIINLNRQRRQAGNGEEYE